MRARGSLFRCARWRRAYSRRLGSRFQVAAFAVEEYRLGAQIADGIAACGEGERGTEDFVAGSDTEEAQAKVNGGGTTG